MMAKKFLALFLVVSALFFCMEEPHTAEAASALSLEQIYRKMSDNFMKRKKSFEIPCSYNDAVDFILEHITAESDSEYYELLFEMSQAVDRGVTTDDGDYLYGLLENVSCYYLDGALRFYDITYFETLRQTKTVNAWTKKIAKKIRKKAHTKYGKIVRTYSYVINRVRYDYRKNPNSSAYSGFVKRKTVCNGYALMVYKILMRLGIPCKFVSGSIKDGKKYYLHAWNMVKYKGKWYNLDACSDDEDDGEVYGDFFMKGDRAFGKTHKKDSFYLTKEFKKKYPMGE